MRNKYLLLGAASALMLAACSEDIKQGPEVNNPAKNALNLTSLDAASQAGRVSLPGQTRGQKANRLQLVAKIAPLSDAASKNWSATGIAIANGNAYVSWHSDHQAHVQATAWGGAVDEISIAALDAKQADGVITNTLSSDGVKFNNVFVDGTNLYFPLTCYRHGAVIGKLAIGSEEMDTIRIPGSSANAIEVNGSTLTAVTGYNGGAYSLSTGFDAENGSREVTPIVAAEKFGGKYVVDGKILRTTDEDAYLYDIASGTEVSLGAPLISELKYAESYDGEGNWVNAGNQAQYYGKHTMAIDGSYTYVGAGQNGLRVYAATGLVWNNNTNTTAVCTDGTYIYAATGAGLRVYEKYDNTADSLPLYAFEVLNYDDNGNAADAPGENKPVAGTDAQSSNFVAVGGGYIFVACGQSGVYVFKLNESATANTRPAGFITIVDGESTDYTAEVEEGDSQKFEVPAAPENDKEFLYWLADNGNKYTPGQDPVTLQAGTVRELTPIYNEPTGFKAEGGVDNIEKLETGKKKEFIVPAAPTTAPEGQEFDYWAGNDGNQYVPDATPELTAGTVIELTPVYKDKAPVYNFTVKFDLEPENTGATGDTPADIQFNGLDKKEYSVKFPAQGNIAREGFDFKGWFYERNSAQAIDDPIYESGKTYTFEIKDGETVKTFYPVWTKKVTQGGGEGGHGTDA